jgi:hypothetical protein
MATWPPESLAADPEVVLNECELMELLPERGAGKQFVQVNLFLINSIFLCACTDQTHSGDGFLSLSNRL